MTRKRKVEVEQNEGQGHGRTFPNKNRQRDYSNDQNEGQDHGRTFPKKNSQNDYSNEYNAGQNHGRSFSKKSRPHDYSRDIEKQYGGVGEWKEGQTYEEPQQQKQDEKTYPTELVSYLKGMGTLIEEQGELDDEIAEKCASECNGKENLLMSFRDSCVVLEQVFGASRFAAHLWLSKLCRLKHKALVELFFHGPAATTIEKLLYAMHPIQESEHVQVITTLLDLLLDNWNDVIACQKSTFLVRCISRVTAGLGKKPENNFSKTSETSHYVSEEMQEALLREFEKLTTAAFDMNLSYACKEHPHSSLLVQDVIAADLACCDGNASNKWLESMLTSGTDILSDWYGKSSSRIWEALMKVASDDQLQRLWSKVIADSVYDLAMSPLANFVLKAFVMSVREEALARKVVEKMNGHLPTFLSSNRVGLIEALVRCCSQHEELQEPLIRQLRIVFNAHSKTTRDQFLLNVLTLNASGPFNVNASKIPGSLLLDALFGCSKVKTLTAGLEAFGEEQLMAMAHHKIASHVLQSMLKSEAVDRSVKCAVAQKLLSDVLTLVDNPHGSHVFELIWTFYNLNEKQTLMKRIIVLHRPSRFWKFALLKCGSELFKRDRKAWIAKMKDV